MKLLSFISLLSIFFYSSFVFCQDEASTEEEVEVVMGLDKVIKLDFVPDAQLQIGDKSKIFVQVIPQKKEITIKGQKVGKSSLKVRDTTGEVKGDFVINVTTNEKAKVVAELKDFLGDIEGIEIGMMGDTVYVGGKIVVPQDIGKIAAILTKYGDVMRLVELSEQTQRVIAKKMQEEIHRNGLTNVNVRIVNGVFLLEGVVDRAGGDELAMSIAKLYLPDQLSSLAENSGTGFNRAKRDQIISLITVNTKEKPQPPPKQLKITSQFVEISKGFNNAFGIAWTPTLAGDGGSVNIGKTVGGEVTTRSSGTLSGTISQLFPRLNAARNAGYARILQSGMIVTKENMEAKISKTTPIVFSVGGTENAQPITFNIGFNLRVKPQILEKENVSMNIGVGVNIPSQRTEQGTPGSTTNEISTEFVVKNKESAAIGGIVVNTNNVDYDKVPGGQVQGGQFLFRFVRQKDYTTSKNQFVVFVTPEIIESASSGVEEIRKKFRRRE